MQELVDVSNNILNETNQVGWVELQSVASGSQTLLQNAERYGTYLASTVNDTDQPVVLVRENISELTTAYICSNFYKTRKLKLILLFIYSCQC